MTNMIFKTISHEKVLRKLFGAKCAYDGRMVFDTPLMLIAFTNRCGSNLLADYLRAARAARDIAQTGADPAG